MNIDRLKGLIKQHDINITIDGLGYGEGNVESLVDLIVEECGEIAYKAYWANPETVRGIHIKEKIKQHFGVGE
jgi:hypothetical protein